ncbi:MAG: twin-arginine translocation signal domain-containing protein [Gemmatimonadales bacterium]|nr:twin-arginine translocation signal domain-containing protein [Gemmatimonadales bacterium]
MARSRRLRGRLRRRRPRPRLRRQGSDREPVLVRCRYLRPAFVRPPGATGIRARVGHGRIRPGSGDHRGLPGLPPGGAPGPRGRKAGGQRAVRVRIRRRDLLVDSAAVGGAAGTTPSGLPGEPPFRRPSAS